MFHCPRFAIERGMDVKRRSKRSYWIPLSRGGVRSKLKRDKRNSICDTGEKPSRRNNNSRSCRADVSEEVRTILVDENNLIFGDFHLHP